MGKTKQVEKKFNRNVEISAPILDPEIIRAIHSPPKDQKIDVRHGGFRALLTDLNSQDSTDELTPITENHLPSYIGISCAVSGYSNYSSYGKRSSENNQRLETSTNNRLTAHKLTSSSAGRPNRSHTNSPVAVRADQPNIHHVTIDKSNINSVEEERRELTEKLTASATERHRSPSPIPPTEDDRHHGAYVGARYFPMPEPSKAVHKHIPLLGIDDDVNPDEVVPEDVNKVEHKIATLYGDDFVEDWKESMSHKAKKEHPEEEGALCASEQASKNLKDLVTLKPTPPKQEDPPKPVADVPTPNIKVLAGVEKQFLNRLLTDESPPMPRSPSPQPTSPIAPKLRAPKREETRGVEEVQQEALRDPVQESPVVSPAQRSSLASGEHEVAPVADPVPEPEPERHESPAEPPRSPSPVQQIEVHESEEGRVTGGGLDQEAQIASEDLVMREEEHQVGSPGAESLIDTNPEHADEPLPSSEPEPQDLVAVSDEVEPESAAEDKNLDLMENSVNELAHETHQNDGLRSEEPNLLSSVDERDSRSPSVGSAASRPDSPNSQVSSSTVERAPATISNVIETEQHPEDLLGDHDIEPEQSTQDLVDLTERPVADEDSSLVTAREIITRETDNLVSFSPEPQTETNNNIEPQVKPTPEEVAAQSNIESAPEKYSTELTSIQESAAEGTVEVSNEPAGNVAAVTDNDDDDDDDDGQTTGKMDGNHFLNLLKAEESFIMEQVRRAEQRLAEHESEMDDDQLGRVHSAIGKANLLINKKCNQFKGLCEQSLNGNANEQYAVLSDDLAGFWDMISIQIADVRKSFENL